MTVLDTVISNTESQYPIKNILALNKEKIKTNNRINLLTSKKVETEKAINNLLAAVEKGLFSNATNLRLKQLEEQLAVIKEQLILEQAKNKSALSKEDLLGYIRVALQKDAKKMINLLVDKIYLYDHKVEIYYKYQRIKSPDDKHQGFLFYKNTASYQKTRVVKNDFIKKTNFEDKQIDVFHNF